MTAISRPCSGVAALRSTVSVAPSIPGRELSSTIRLTTSAVDAMSALPARAAITLRRIRWEDELWSGLVTVVIIMASCYTDHFALWRAGGLRP